MIIGVVSDIHGRLSNEAYEALSGSDYILCAGDIENRMVLTELETIAPTICVRGNCDRYDLGPRVKPIASPLLDGCAFVWCIVRKTSARCPMMYRLLFMGIRTFHVRNTVRMGCCS